jgi:hypothetical protein
LEVPLLGIIPKVVALALFLLAAVNQDLLGQGPGDLVAFGLASWVLSELVGGIVFSRP